LRSVLQLPVSATAIAAMVRAPPRPREPCASSSDKRPGYALSPGGCASSAREPKIPLLRVHPISRRTSFQHRAQLATSGSFALSTTRSMLRAPLQVVVLLVEVNEFLVVESISGDGGGRFGRSSATKQYQRLVSLATLSAGPLITFRFYRKRSGPFARCVIRPRAFRFGKQGRVRAER